MAVVGQRVAVVRSENDYAVFEIAFGLEGLDDLPDLLVDHCDVGEVISTLPVPLLVRRIEQVHDRIVVDLMVVLAHFFERRRLAFELCCRYFQQRQIALEVWLGIPRHRIIRRMRAGEADLQKQRLGLWETVDPPGRHVAHEHVGMRIFGQFPLEGPEPLAIIGQLAIELALLFDQPAGRQGLVPLVEVVTAFEVAVFVFDNISLVETGFGLERPGVHLADVRTVVAGIVEQLDPRSPPHVGILENAGGMRVIPLKQAGPRRCTGSRGHMAVGKRNAFANQTVEVGRVDVVVAKAANRVETLLVGDDEDNVRPFLGHEPAPLLRNRCR